MKRIDLKPEDVTIRVTWEDVRPHTYGDRKLCVRAEIALFHNSQGDVIARLSSNVIEHTVPKGADALEEFEANIERMRLLAVGSLSDYCSLLVNALTEKGYLP